MIDSFPVRTHSRKETSAILLPFLCKRKQEEKGNSLFLDRTFEPYSDQWLFLSSVERIPQEKIEDIVREESKKRGITDVFMIQPDGEEGRHPMGLSYSLKWTNFSIQEALPERAKIVLANLIFVEKESVPQAMISRLLHLAAFQNPEFYKAEAMRALDFRKTSDHCLRRRFCRSYRSSPGMPG